VTTAGAAGDGEMLRFAQHDNDNGLCRGGTASRESRMTLPHTAYPILVTGAAGLLGHALAPRLLAAAPSPGAVLLTDVGALDVTDPAAVRRTVREFAPRTVFHLAAWTDVDGAEAAPERAGLLNVSAAADVAREAARAGALIVHMSTDFVFGGYRQEPYAEDDRPCPAGVYAVTKADAETAVRAAAPANHLIVRTAWLYGAGGRNFVDAILAAARRGGPLRVVTDQEGCPTWSEDLADALVALVAAGARGTYHACGRGEASRFVQAVETVRAAGLDVAVESTTSAAHPRPAPRPARAILSTAKLARLLGHDMPPWRDSLRRYVAERQ
jgi:dTDP-4-dehydrorhamnose reductase